VCSYVCCVALCVCVCMCVCVCVCVSVGERAKVGRVRGPVLYIIQIRDSLTEQERQAAIASDCKGHIQTFGLQSGKLVALGVNQTFEFGCRGRGVVPRSENSA